MDSKADNNSDPKLKGPHQYTDEELEKILQTGLDEPLKELSQETDVPHFISAFKIEFGENRIYTGTLYKLYKEWSKDFSLSRKQFINQMNLHIPSEFRGGKHYYFVNLSSIAITGKTREMVLQRKIEKTKSKHSREHFETYLKLFDVIPGDFWIDARDLYYIYTKWLKDTGKRRGFGQVVFNNFCRLYFQTRRRKDKAVWVAVQGWSILKHISLKKIKRLKQERLEKREENKKKSNKVSKPLSRTES